MFAKDNYGAYSDFSSAILQPAIRLEKEEYKGIIYERVAFVLSARAPYQEHNTPNYIRLM